MTSKFTLSFTTSNECVNFSDILNGDCFIVDGQPNLMMKISDQTSWVVTNGQHRSFYWNTKCREVIFT